MRGSLKAEKDSSPQSNPSTVLPVSVGKSVRAALPASGRAVRGSWEWGGRIYSGEKVVSQVS